MKSFFGANKSRSLRAVVSTINVVCLLMLSLLLAGCESLGFYTQAARGQWQLLGARESIDDVLARDSTTDELKRRLLLTNDVRAFARDTLALPVGDNFATYADVNRPYVIWNVFAAPELSVRPLTWCYPIAGCVSYRGYFDQDAAQAKASALSDEGFEVYVGGVRAYSTLGWFDDSVLSTYIMQSEAYVAGLIFHELAHQVVYVSDDTAFNESFAQSVELMALREYATARSAHMDAATTAAFARYEDDEKKQQAFTQLLLKTRNALDAVFQSSQSDEQKRAAKQAIMLQLASDFAQLKASWGDDARYDAWMQNVNNARLATVADYHQWIDAFRVLRAQSQNWQHFYARAIELGNLSAPAREQALRALLGQFKSEQAAHTAS